MSQTPSERTVAWRAMMSACQSGLAFDSDGARAEEKLIEFVKCNYTERRAADGRAELAEVRKRVVQANSEDHQHPQ